MVRIPNNLSTASLYLNSTKICLPFSEFQEEFKAAKICNLAIFQKSKDPFISGWDLNLVVGGKTPNQ